MKNNKNIMQFSAEAGLLIFTVLSRYRLLRLFVTDEAKKMLCIFTRGADKTIVLDETATLANLDTIQFEQRGIYRYQLDSDTTKRFFTVFVVVEPVRGGPKRCEAYRVIVSCDENGQPTTHPEQFFKEAKPITGKLIGGVDSETAKTILDYVLGKSSSAFSKTDTVPDDTEIKPADTPDSQKPATDPVAEAAAIPMTDQRPPFVKLTPEQCEEQILLLLSEISCKEAFVTTLKRELDEQKAKNTELQQELVQKQVKIDQLNSDLVFVRTQAAAIMPLQLQVDAAAEKRDIALREQQEQYEDRLSSFRKTIFMLIVIACALALLCGVFLSFFLAEQDEQDEHLFGNVSVNVNETKTE